MIKMFQGNPTFSRDQTLSLNDTAHRATLNRILEYILFAQNVFSERL